MTVSVVIPIWNGRSLLEKNLPSLIEASRTTNNGIDEIIIVDDASPDDSIAFVKANYKSQVRIVRLKKNKGFAGAVNMGFYAARSPLVCLLNIDVVPSKNFLASTVPLFTDKKVFAVSLHEKGFGPAKGLFKKGFIVHSPGKEGTQVCESFWASGGSAVFNRAIWMKLKGFDEELLNPFYWEDVDISYRAWKRGYKVLWDPSAHVEHKHEATINADYFSRNYLSSMKQRNYLLFNWKNITSPVLWRRHRRELSRYVMRHPGYARIVFLALQKRAILKKRREKEMAQSTVSDEVIFARFDAK